MQVNNTRYLLYTDKNELSHCPLLNNHRQIWLYLM